MSITLHFPAQLRAYAGLDTSELRLPGGTVREVLGEVERSHPSLYRSICDETGTLRRHVNLFVNESRVRDPEGLEARLAPGDVLTVLPAVSGG